MSTDKLREMYDVQVEGEFIQLTCKGCGKIRYFMLSDKAAMARSLNHGFSHRGVLQPALPVPSPSSSGKRG